MMQGWGRGFDLCIIRLLRHELKKEEVPSLCATEPPLCRGINDKQRQRAGIEAYVRVTLCVRFYVLILYRQ